MFKQRSGILPVLIITIAFFSISFLTISHYGINWDGPIHYMRGQGYLHFFLTGEKQYLSPVKNRSYYQNDQLTAKYYFDFDSGHPPLNGILAATSNYIFFQKLHVLGDLESYHLFNIFISAVLVLVVCLFAYESVGLFASIIAGLSLSFYPLFFGESHFNIKDPVEAAFFGITIYTFWKAFQTWNYKWLILSSIAFGFGLGTKFNVLFLPIIAIPWIIYKVFILDKGKTKFSKKFLLAVLISPVVVGIIFFGTWPFLWPDPINRLVEVFGYYKQIGTGYNYQTAMYYLPFGFNSYPLIWIIFTTPPFILFLSVLGIISAIFNFKRKDGAPLLWLIWLLAPIARVTLPNSSIYGGVRQIMEYIPAMALLSALGADLLRNFLIKIFPKINKNLILFIFLIGFFQIGLVLIKLHPNENVYFNSLAGGLAGAKEKNIPSWGNSFGNAYHQGIAWINKNAPRDANLALIQGTTLNIYKTALREDIRFNNLTWSGINRQGEYLMELTHESPVKVYPYAWSYIEAVLDPVYEIKVDGVAIAKVWKNDLAHSKKQFQKEESEIEFEIEKNVKEKYLLIKLKKDVLLTKITISHQILNCDKPKGHVALSADGNLFINEPDPYPNEFVTEPNPKVNTIYQYFALPKIRYIKFIDSSANSCLFQGPVVSVKGF